MKRIFLASDHAGFDLKNRVRDHILSKYPEFELIDFGAYFKNDKDDYPDFIHFAAKAVSNSIDDRAIIFGGSGQGEAMVANRYRNVRASVINSENLDLVSLSRRHNNTNILSIGARFISEEFAKKVVQVFLTEKFDFDTRHFRRIQKISHLPQYKVVPAILETNFKLIKEKISILSNLTKDFQIDVSDGVLTPYKTFPFIGRGPVNDDFLKDFNVELHLMVQDNLAFLEQYGDFHASSIVLQIQSRDSEKAVKHLKNKAKYKLGVSITPNTKLMELEKFLPYIDYIQVMSIDEIGKQGSVFSKKAPEKTKEIKRYLPDIPVFADGGIKTENITLLKDAGAERFAVGSGIYGTQSPTDSFKKMSKILTEEE